jgi:hypothetical protein
MYYDSYFYYWLTALLFIIMMMFILFICLRNYYSNRTITLWHVRTPTLEAQAADNLQRNISHLDLNASEVR